MLDWLEQFEIIKEVASKKIQENGGGRFSLAKFDNLLGISGGKSRKWAKGQRPSAEDLGRICRKLDLSAAWLLLGEGGLFLGEETDTQKEDAPITDPIAQRMKVATDILKGSGASPEVIQQAVMKILDSQNETHTQAETNTLEASAFADKCDWSMKRT
ncbi:XRE family transcriptional regulator [Halodesulfovibrio aestuarii]|uniref:Uncharacterized protein n=1 Tax=Halodesulfovibrio aestuarii TaxID=126333 RepID=A0A8G2CCB4_9BACT|nr:hypothetical protein [Halodesulfovibrio aestuarii]SHJ76627.1 hypothetical protein SAMN05660830_03171 [Halodesulfovibrio aestuarii]